MSKNETQLNQLLEGLQHLQHSLQQVFSSELHDSQTQLNQIQHQVQQRIGRESKRIGQQSRRLGRQVSKRLTQGLDSAPISRQGLAMSLGLLVLGGLGFAIARNLRGQQQAKASLTSVHGLDLNRFAGKWFEIARLPGKHNDIAGMTLTYTLNADNSLDVVCTYHDHDLDGPEHTERKHIHIGEADNRSHLRKQVFGPISTDYWVLEVGKNYEYAVLGTPSRKHLWVLSRSPKFDQARYEEILGRMREQGFAVDKLIRIQHDETPPVALSSHLQALLEQKQAYFKGEEAEKHRGPKAHDKHGDKTHAEKKPHEKREEV